MARKKKTETFDVIFHSDKDKCENWLSFEKSYNECLDYINKYKGTNKDFFEYYKSEGDYVAIQSNITFENVYKVAI